MFIVDYTQTAAARLPHVIEEMTLRNVAESDKESKRLLIEFANSILGRCALSKKEELLPKCPQSYWDRYRAKREIVRVD